MQSVGLRVPPYSQKVAITSTYNKSPYQMNADDRRSSSSTINQFGSIKIKGAGAGHKDYLKNMLLGRLLKKFPTPSKQTVQLVEDEVAAFCASEYITKESMKQLESRVARKLNPHSTEVPSQRTVNTHGDLPSHQHNTARVAAKYASAAKGENKLIREAAAALSTPKPHNNY